MDNTANILIDVYTYNKAMVVPTHMGILKALRKMCPRTPMFQIINTKTNNE